MIDTVIFDLGGVLVDFHPTEGMRNMGFSEEAIKVFKEKIFSGLWEECDRYPYEDEEIRRLFKKTVPRYEKEVDMMWDNLHPISCTFPYSVDWLKSLKEKGLKVYVLSNFGKRAFEINSEIYPFLEYIDGKVVSYELECVKPEPEIYEALIKKYAVTPENAVFIDDREINIQGAIACGLKGIVFESFEQANGELESMLQQA
jgi:putative hydrolase of the HAD superfamily